ncbi:hypothetical protein AVEN_88459-1 [Araneus ventricosus]|uniref:Uncharacterized protein n=1 Tax=Araneus ventricosus TaxID=182803 RepID=A0A4Y2JG78_ARAVE|nr:hypothetical protein AVEN_88459-1 [Araneus ventricosus]
MRPCYGNVHPIQLVSSPHIFMTLGLVADSTLQVAVQQDMPGDIFWLFSCWVPGQSHCNANIQARADDQIICSLDLAGLHSAPHAPFDEMVSPSHFRTATR